MNLSLTHKATIPVAARRPARWGFAARLGVVWFALMLLTGVARAGAPSALAEHQIKALYLFNFIKYVDWPASAMAATNSPYTIGIVQDGDLGDDLQELTRSRRVNGREIVIKAVHYSEEAKGCHILFISSTADKRTRQAMLDAVAGLPVLTVKDGEDSGDGAAIRFVPQDNNLRPEIDLNAVQRANLTLSPKLLAVAILTKERVEAGKNK